MLTKKTSKNQITLPKAIVDQVPGVDYFEVSVEQGAIILKPVTVTVRGEHLAEIRRKVAALGMAEEDVEAAIRWARSRKA